MSILEAHLRFNDILTGGHFSVANKYMTEHGFTFRDLCAPQNKHCITNPIYASLAGIRSMKPENRSEGKEYIKSIVETTPELMDIVTNRVNVLSYTIMNMDEPDLVQYFIDKRPDMKNDQSRYDKEQTSEFSSTFKIYKPSYNSPTHEATMFNRLNSLDVLIKNGANVNLKNIADVTPMDQYFYNCNRLDSSIPGKLAAAGGDVTSNGYYAVSLSHGITNKCWTGLNNFLPTSGVKMSEFHFTKIIEGAVANGVANLEAANTAHLALSHMAPDFDVAKFSAKFCPAQDLNNRGACQEVLSTVISMHTRHTHYDETPLDSSNNVLVNSSLHDALEL